MRRDDVNNKRRLGRWRERAWPLLVGFGQLFNGWRAEQHYRSFPELSLYTGDDPPFASSWPGVSVIVPARNEERNLRGLLSSLVQQSYPLYEVIVVDDDSTDGTADIMREFSSQGVRLLQTSGPPEGWTGKNRACWLGAGASVYPWLLFVDADTQLRPLALRSTLAFALEQQLEVLSLFAQQRCESFWERLLLPFAYQNYFVGIQARTVHAERGPALANGQYFLIKDAVYRSVGGHAANRASITDDISLADSLKRVGAVPFVARGEAVLSVRMYTQFSELAEGFGKNAYLFLSRSWRTGMQTALSTWLAAAVPWLFVDGVLRRSPWRIRLAMLAYLAQLGGALSWYRRFKVPRGYLFLTPLASVTFLGIALGSMLRVLTGRKLAWKGRSYRGVVPKQPRYPFPRRWILEMGQAMLFKTPRSIVEDSALAVHSMPVAPQVSGLEHLPPEGSFVLLANHYQRPGLWIGWSGAVLIEAVTSQRDVEIQFVTTDRARVGRFEVPGTHWIFERVATVWGLQRVTPGVFGVRDERRQRYALLHLMRVLRRRSQPPVCLIMMPEGDEGTASGLIEPVPGSGRALAAISGLGIPLVPAAVWEEDGRLQVRFGQAFALASNADDLADKGQERVYAEKIMLALAGLLPPALRGRYAARTVLDQA